MAWIIGIDEAGYGPNLGPLVMTAAACQVPDRLAGANLWHVLRRAVRRGEDDKDSRLLIDDSKIVYSTGRGLLGLEVGVLATLWRAPASIAADLAALLEWTCPDSRADLHGEPWYRGRSTVPVRVQPGDLTTPVQRFDRACTRAGIARWLARSVVLCPPG